MREHLTVNSYVRDIVNHAAFKGFGELLLPRDDNSGYYNTPLRDIGRLMPYHSHVEPEIVAGAINHLIDEASEGNSVFYNFYSSDDKAQDPAKRHTGLFFFRGNPGAPFAIICPGGGFSYVGSLHEGFPLALELSQKGFNAFVIRYRLGSGQRATEDLAKAVAFLCRNAEVLEISRKGYSLWGGSAGARMVGNIAMDGISFYGGGDLPPPAVVVIAYTGQSSYSSSFPPAFLTVAANDRIASATTMERRADQLKKAGVDVEYRGFRTAGHGFGLGTGTDAEGWLDLAVQFWQRHLDE